MVTLGLLLVMPDVYLPPAPCDNLVYDFFRTMFSAIVCGNELQRICLMRGHREISVESSRGIH